MLLIGWLFTWITNIYLKVIVFGGQLEVQHVERIWTDECGAPTDSHFFFGKMNAMFTKDGLRAFHTWTHERLDLVFSHAAKLTHDELLRELTGFGRASVRDQLLHIVACEDVWVHDLQDIPRRRWQSADYPTVEALEQARQTVREQTNDYLDRLPESQLSIDLVQSPREWGGALRTPAFILHHVLTHAFHHKGQVVAMFRLIGHPAPDTDLQP